MSTPTQPCPECRVGKHGNCTHWALDHRDQEVACPCDTARHGLEVPSENKNGPRGAMNTNEGLTSRCTIQE